MKFIFTGEYTDGTKITLSGEEVSLPELLRNFEYFLRGAGFHFDGAVDIVEEDDE